MAHYPWKFYDNKDRFSIFYNSLQSKLDLKKKNKDISNNMF